MDDNSNSFVDRLKSALSITDRRTQELGLVSFRAPVPQPQPQTAVQAQSVQVSAQGPAVQHHSTHAHGAGLPPAPKPPAYYKPGNNGNKGTNGNTGVQSSISNEIDAQPDYDDFKPNITVDETLADESDESDTNTDSQRMYKISDAIKIPTAKDIRRNTRAQNEQSFSAQYDNLMRQLNIFTNDVLNKNGGAISQVIRDVDTCPAEATIHVMPIAQQYNAIIHKYDNIQKEYDSFFKVVMHWRANYNTVIEDLLHDIERKTTESQMLTVNLGQLSEQLDMLVEYVKTDKVHDNAELSTNIPAIVRYRRLIANISRQLLTLEQKDDKLNSAIELLTLRDREQHALEQELIKQRDAHNIALNTAIKDKDLELVRMTEQSARIHKRNQELESIIAHTKPARVDSPAIPAIIQKTEMPLKTADSDTNQREPYQPEPFKASTARGRPRVERQRDDEDDK
jgi:hypothetical protein